MNIDLPVGHLQTIKPFLTVAFSSPMEKFCIDRTGVCWQYERIMPRESIILECTEARKEGKPPSRYVSSRNKKLQTELVEKKKYNRFLRKHTLHREIKS